MDLNSADVASPPKSEALSPVLAAIVKPETTAIIVVDVMDAYFDAEAVLPQLFHTGTAQLVETAKRISSFIDESRKFPTAATIFVRMIERPDSMTENYRYKMEDVHGVPPLVEVDGPGWNYYEIQPQATDHQIVKTHYNAFTGTNLHEYLKAKSVKTLIIIGGYGSRCVASTAIVAADVYGYNVFVPNDLIANLDAADKTYGGPKVDEIPGFLQALDAIWGYAPASRSILETWRQL